MEARLPAVRLHLTGLKGEASATRHLAQQSCPVTPMLKFIIATMLVVAAGAAAFFALSWWSFEGRIRDHVAALETRASRDSVSVTETMLAGLPAPARRFLAHARVADHPIPRIVRLEQTGRIRSSPETDWMTFEAEQVYSTDPPAFVWRAWLPGRAMPLVIGRDTYLGGESSILMRMLGTIPVADERGPELAHAGLMRYLNEMTLWFPAALLGGNVTMGPVDDEAFRVSISDGGLTATAVVFVDSDGRLTNFRADRYNTATGTVETWETPVAAHPTRDGVNLPASGAGVWKLPAGDFRYIELDVRRVVYDDAPHWP